MECLEESYSVWWECNTNYRRPSFIHLYRVDLALDSCSLVLMLFCMVACRSLAALMLSSHAFLFASGLLSILRMLL